MAGRPLVLVDGIARDPEHTRVTIYLNISKRNDLLHLWNDRTEIPSDGSAF